MFRQMLGVSSAIMKTWRYFQVTLLDRILYQISSRERRMCGRFGSGGMLAYSEIFMSGRLKCRRTSWLMGPFRFLSTFTLRFIVDWAKGFPSSMAFSTASV